MAGKSELAKLISMLGVGIIGFGLGAILADYVQQYVFWIMLFGLAMHGWGMYKTNPSHRIFSWTSLLYWLCWVIIIALVVWVSVKLV